MKQAKGPEFIRFFKPILEVLRQLGGSGTASEIVDSSFPMQKVSRRCYTVTSARFQRRNDGAR